MAKRKPGQMAPEEALQFLEDMRTLASDIDEPTVAISIRIPANVLRAIKAKATLEKRKYQSLVVEFIRRGLKHP